MTERANLPTILCIDGRRVDDMGREELIAALRQAYQEIERMRLSSYSANLALVEVWRDMRPTIRPR